MRTAPALALFDLTALNPDQPRTCGWCGQQPATIRVYAADNLLGVHDPSPTRYRHATRRARSGPCCDPCARYVASAWWNPTYACPRGTCWVWGRTLTDPHPDWECKQHHREHTVVWLTPIGGAS